MRFAHRLDQVPPYLFAEIERRIEAMRADGVDVISLGIGDPDLPTPPPVVEALQRAAERPETHQYPSNRGLPSLPRGGRRLLRPPLRRRRRPGPEVIPVLGGKEAVAHVALACLDPGDVALAPDPATRRTHRARSSRVLRSHYLPLRDENAFMPDLDAIPTAIASQANVLYFNYPNNPTGAVVADGFFERRSPFRGSTTSSRSTTPPTPRSRSTATVRRAFSPRLARRTSASRSSRSPRAGT